MQNEALDETFVEQKVTYVLERQGKLIVVEKGFLSSMPETARNFDASLLGKTKWRVKSRLAAGRLMMRGIGS